MSKLIKFLKPFKWLILLIFVLLFAQAFADLALPGYMSNILNVGVQQNGIENTVPTAIQASEMNRIQLFMSADDRAEVAQVYTLLDKSSLSNADYANFVKSYHILATSPVYKLGKVTKTETTELEAIFGKAEDVTFAIEQQGLTPFLPAGTTLPAGTDPFVYISHLPPDVQATMLQTVNSTVSALPKEIISQSAIAYLAIQYKAIGISLSHL